MANKNLATVEQQSDMTSNTNVIIEENNVIKKLNLENAIEKNIKIFSGEISNVGSRSWRDYRITFPEPFTEIPFVNIMPTTLFSMENICLREVTTTGLVYSVYEQTDFTFGTRWMAIGY